MDLSQTVKKMSNLIFRDVICRVVFILVIVLIFGAVFTFRVVFSITVIFIFGFVFILWYVFIFGVVLILPSSAKPQLQPSWLSFSLIWQVTEPSPPHPHPSPDTSRF